MYKKYKNKLWLVIGLIFLSYLIIDEYRLLPLEQYFDRQIGNLMIPHKNTYYHNETVLVFFNTQHYGSIVLDELYTFNKSDKDDDVYNVINSIKTSKNRIKMGMYGILRAYEDTDINIFTHYIYEGDKFNIYIKCPKNGYPCLVEIIDLDMSMFYSTYFVHHDDILKVLDIAKEIQTELKKWEIKK